MLYGNLIFIKKTGGDGSKFPVTEKDIKIGRSEDCLIRIYNPQVASEHCQLIIQDNGQTTLRNLSNQTILNGKPLGQGDVTLCHGDIFKLGERLVRWEYLPTSKYCKQLLSPTGRLVAVVMPQQRSLDDQAIPGTSASQNSVLKNTPLGKRRYSDRGALDNSSTVKIRKSSGSELIQKSRGDVPKFLTSRLSLKTKFLLPAGKVRERKSTSGVASSKTLKEQVAGKSRKSTMPSWKVNILSPRVRKSSGGRKSVTKSNKKSAKSPKSSVKTPLKNVVEAESSQKLLSSVIKNGLKTPQKIVDSKVLVKSSSKSVKKTPLKPITESPASRCDISGRSTRSLSKSPSPKKSPKSPSKVVLSTPNQKPLPLSRIVHSESKLNSGHGKLTSLPKGSKRMSLILERTDWTPGLIKKSYDVATTEKSKVKLSDEIVPVSESQINSLNEPPVKENKTRKSVKRTPAKKSPGRTPRKSSLQLKSPIAVKMKTLRKSVIMKTPESLKQKKPSTPIMTSSKEVAQDVGAQTPLLIDLDYTPSPKRAKHTPRKSVKGIPVKKTPGKLITSVGKNKSPSASRRISIRQIESPAVDIATVKAVSTSASPTRTSAAKQILARKAASPSKSDPSSPRGVRRKLSPSSSAERAAKMLKTSSPKKPDKNKKAALLVLGKANRKQLLSQNVKVLLKQKIVKKAIKQSTAGVSQKVEAPKILAAKVKKRLRKTGLKPPKKFVKKSSAQKTAKISGVSPAKSPVEKKEQDGTPKGKAVVEANQMSPSKVQSSARLFTKSKSHETPGKSSKQNKKPDSPRSILSPKSLFSSITETPNFDKTAESYLFNSNRRSKRLSSKNDTGRPDFIELSPTALGLIPKNVTIFKTPKDTKRRSSSLVTPKSVRTTGIIKSASTSKIGNRKSVRFSSKDVSYNSEFHTPNTTEKAEFDFSSYNTPDVTVDTFVSPLTDKSSKKELNESKVTSVSGSTSKSSSAKIKINSDPKKCVRKLLESPQIKKSTASPPQKSLPTSTRNFTSKSPSPTKVSKASNEKRSPKNELKNVKGVRQLFATPKDPKSPKNDLTDVNGVKQLFQTPKLQKSPKNDLTDVRGVKKLLKTPKVQKSPKNDLTDVRGVKKLLKTPKVQKSPKNDLTDVRGVKKLLKTPKAQKSPKNDLTDLRGVKKLLRTPKLQKSPKNDLTDVEGVKNLLRTPKAQKSPKNDLSDLRGVKRLLGSPKAQKSPKNDLSNVAGVKQLLGSPKVQKSPKNELSDLRGVKRLLGSPKVQKSPKNDLTDVTGVKKLLTTPRVQKSPKNNLLDVSGVGSLFTSPAVQKLSRSSATAIRMLPSSEESPSQNAVDVAGVKQLLISKSPENVVKNKKTISRKSHVNDYRAIRGRRTIYATPKTPKNDLSDVAGVRELFSRHKPTSDYNINLTGVAELFDLPTAGMDSRPKKGRKPQKTSMPAPVQISPAKKTVKQKIEEIKENVTVTRRGHLRKDKTQDLVAVESPSVSKKELEKRATSKKTKTAEVKKPVKRKAAEKIQTSEPKKTAVGKKSENVTKKETSTRGKKSLKKTKTETLKAAEKVVEVSRKRKVDFEEVQAPPSKLRRKQHTAEKSDSALATAASKGVASKIKKEAVSEKKVSVKRSRKVEATAKDSKTSRTTKKVQPKTAVKSGTKKTEKVQNRSQSKPKTNTSDSIVEKAASPRKTRSGKSSATSKVAQKKVPKTESKTVGKKTAKSTAGRTKVPPVVKKSTRRK